MPSFGRAIRLTLLIVFVLPVAAKALVWSLEERPRNWWEARWTSAGILPAPADDPEPRIKQVLRRDGRSREDFDLNEVLASVGLRRELAKAAALPAGAGLVDELAEPLVVTGHFGAGSGQPMAEDRLGYADHSGSLLIAESQNFTKHQRRLLFGRKRARDA